MAVADTWNLQLAVVSALQAARTTEGETADTVPIFDHGPSPSPDRYIRLEGFDMVDESFKNGEMGRHIVTVSYWETGGAAGQQRITEVMIWMHAALKDLQLGRGRMDLETMDIEPNTEMEEAMGRLRYSIVI